MIPTQPTAQDAPSVSSRFLDDVLRGLSAPRKTLPSKYFYDAEGSRLFEAICELPEYYLTRTETALLADIAPELAAFVADGAALVEFGSGASAKTRLILDASPQIDVYVPIDISEAALAHAAKTISADYLRLRWMARQDRVDERRTVVRSVPPRHRRAEVVVKHQITSERRV